MHGKGLGYSIFSKIIGNHLYKRKLFDFCQNENHVWAAL